MHRTHLRIMGAFMAGTIVLGLSSCLTGDPNSGGIFWSEDHAKMRLKPLQNKHNAKQKELRKTEKENLDLKHKYNDIQRNEN